MIKEITFKEFIKEILENSHLNRSYVEHGVFDSFYTRFLGYIEDKVAALIRNLNTAGSLKLEEETIVKSIVYSTKDNLIEIAIKTLIVEFYDRKEKGLLTGSSSEEIYKSFDASLDNASEIEAILDRYEALSYIIYQRLTTKYILIEEALTRLFDDIEELRVRFNKKFQCVESIYLNSGDTHNGGKSVMILNFDNSEKLVYKPHGLSTDETLNEIYDFLNSKNSLQANLFNAKVLDRESYGWQDFITYEGCENTKEASTYYYKIGVILALFNILKAGDIHSENIIAAKDNPTIIDLETLLTNDNTEGLDDTLFLSYLLEINNSVLGCYLLPQNLEHSTIDIDLSGLAGEGGQKSDKITYFALKDKGTDRIRFEKEFVVSEENNNKPKINSTKLEILDFMTDIEKGFIDAYSVIKDNKEEFLTLLYRTLDKGLYRQVLRPTFVYARYLQASYHPKYLKTLEDRVKLFTLLKDSDKKIFNDNEMKKLKCDEEVMSLVNGDIPYFASDFSTRTLYIDNKKTINNYFHTTIKAIVTERVKSLDDKTMATQVVYIRNSIITTKKDLFHNNSPEGERIPIKKDDMVSSLRAIGDYIYDRAIFSTNRDKCTYTNLNIHGDRTLIGSLNYSLYDGGGLVLFLYALGKELKDEKYIRLAEASLKGIEELYPHDKTPMSSSVFSGIGSLVYLYYNLAYLNNDDSFYEKYLYHMKKLNSYEIAENELLDIIGGVSGVIITALNIYKQNKNSTALAVAEKYSRYLYSKLNEDKNWAYLSGFSHGYSGFALALSMAGSVLDKKEYSALALDLVKKEDSLYREDLKNWIDLRSKEHSALSYWCHGAPGILLSRVKMLNYVDKESKPLLTCKLQDALEGFIESGFYRQANHSLCHGTLGNLDILTTIAQELKSDTLKAKADKLFKNAMTYMAADGIKYGLFNTLGMVNFMTGLSGIGYSILRQKDSTLPSVLSLDVVNKEMISI